MAKIKLGDRPKNFKRVIKFPLLEGGEGAIEVVYKYRTRKEFGQFIDTLVDAVKAKNIAVDSAGDGEKFSMTALMEKTAGANADYIMQVMEDWNLEADFSAANVQQLADEFPGAANAIMETYREAITEGRLKN